MSTIKQNRTFNIPDTASIQEVELPTIVRNALERAGLRTVGDVRMAPDEVILRTRRMAKGRLKLVREALDR